MAATATKRVMSHTEILSRQGQAKPVSTKRERATGAESHRLWQSRIQAALRYRQSHWNGDDNWKRAYKLYGGRHWRYQDETSPATDEARENITVNITMSVVNNMVPYLINSDPYLLTKPRKPSDVVSARLQQEVLNYEFKLQRCIDQLKEAATDAAIIGHGITKSGFTFELDTASSKSDGSIVYNDFIKAETGTITRVDPFCFIFDPTAPDRTLRTARWAGEIFFAPFDDVIVNTRYSAKVRDAIKKGEVNPTCFAVSESYGSSSADDDYTIYEDIDEDAPKLIKLFEIWDKKFRTYFVFAEGVEEPLLEKPWPYPYLTGFPYRWLDFIKLPNQHFGVGIPYSIEDQQYELNRTRTYQFQHRRRFNRKYRVSDRLPEPERNKLVDGEDGTVIACADDIQISAIEDAPIPQDQYALEGTIKQDVYELSGMDNLIRGGVLPSRTTGTEINTRTNVFRMKIDQLVSQTDQWVLDNATDLLKHLKANLLRERVVKITGLQGTYWVTMNNSDIQAEVDVEMESIAAPKTDPTLDKQQAIQLLQIVTQLQQQLAQSGQPLQINMPEMLSWVIEKFGYKDVGRFFQQALIPPAPLQEGQPSPQSSGNPTPQGATPSSPMTAADLQNQFGIASIQNASGLQL